MYGVGGYAQKIKAELIKKGLVSHKEFLAFEAESERSQKSLLDVLYESKKVPEKDLTQIFSSTLGYPPINLATVSIDEDILDLVPINLAKKYQVLPISRYEKTLMLAMSDPTNLEVLDNLGAQFKFRIKPVITSPEQLRRAIRKYYDNEAASAPGNLEGSFDDIVQGQAAKTTESAPAKGLADLSDLTEDFESAPFIRLVNNFIVEAVRRKASDVFVEPLEKSMRVRIRVDGLLEQILNSPRNFVEPVISRIKVMSCLNIAEHRIPQDGRFKAQIAGSEIDFRVSILPTCYGEKACLRILDPKAETANLDQLGFGQTELEVIRHCAAKPHGMILVTGPTGSGKTTTLYAVLQYLNSPEKNITTVEEPVEYQAVGINQVNVRERVGLTFPAALRSILRQDPDIILIGEIRDLVTMDIAVKAALTGHLVLSTLHTNDATSAIVRMINIGIEPFLIASSVLMISAQRLVRKLCLDCRVPYAPSQEILESLNLPKMDKYTFYKPGGCDRCRSSGYKGRTVITELFEMRPAILDLIMRGGSNDELRDLTREMGMQTLRDNGITKAKEGISSLEEVLRVTSPEKGIKT